MDSIVTGVGIRTMGEGWLVYSMNGKFIPFKDCMQFSIFFVTTVIIGDTNLFVQYIFTAPEELGIQQPNAIYFDMPDQTDRSLQKATLWVYVTPSDQQHVTEIYLYTLVKRSKSSDTLIKQFLYRKKRTSRGWQQFNLLNEVEKWTEDPSYNRGLVVEAVDEQGRNVVVMPSSDDNGYVSFKLNVKQEM